MRRVAKEIEAMRERREEVEVQNLEFDLDYYYPGFSVDLTQNYLGWGKAER